MSYELGMGLGVTYEGLQQTVYARGHAVRSQPECSAAQLAAMTRLRESLNEAAGQLSSMTPSFRETYERALYTMTETSRRCEGRWEMPLPGDDGGALPADGGDIYATSESAGAGTALAVIGGAIALVGGGILLLRWRKRRKGLGK